MAESKLYIVPTPIGNLGDITIRAIEVLKSADQIFAEDTRQASKLLNHYGIATPCKSYHMHNEHKLTGRLVNEMQQSGKTYALISDAGTPSISDPGYLLVKACVENEIKVECLPGATALIPALVESGLPASSFVFEGFLPHQKGRTKRLEALRDEGRTMIFYESPHRLLKTLNQFAEFFGADRLASVSREISKIHQETIRGTLEFLKEHFEEHPVKGEIVIIVHGKK